MTHAYMILNPNRGKKLYRRFGKPDDGGGRLERFILRQANIPEAHLSYQFLEGRVVFKEIKEMVALDLRDSFVMAIEGGLQILKSARFVMQEGAGLGEDVR